MGDGTETPDVNALLDEARIPLAIKAASIALGAAGLLVALFGVQNLVLVHWIDVWAVLPYVLIALGVAGIGVAAKLVRARSWTLAAGLVVSALLAASSAGFFGLSVISGVFGSLSVLAVAASVTALVLTAIAVGPFRRLAATRRKLRDAGYDLDL